jgi:hypothetical protein
MNENEMDKNGATSEGEKASRRRVAKAGGAQDVLKLIDVARAAGVKEIAKLRALAKEYTERADAIERKLGSMLEIDLSSKSTGTELDVSGTTVDLAAKRERPAVAESVTARAPADKPARMKRFARDVAPALGRIIDLLNGQPQGMRAEEICEALGLRPKDIPLVLKEGLDSHRLQSKGEKRSTVYFAK